MFGRIRKDIRAVFERDPAARSTLEVLLCYSGLHAIWFHRIAHWLWRRNMHVSARFVSQVARLFTGIEIHPGATIGEGLFIDHGMGVVIGETTEIGRNVTLYQGVTLGGTGKERGKRHPTIGDHAVIGVGAKVLGGITIGDYSIIGGGAVVLKPVPPHCMAAGVPARVITCRGVRVEDLVAQRDRIPDVMGDLVDRLQARLGELEARVRNLEAGQVPESEQART
jgi:serine O-acetyltransferase